MKKLSLLTLGAIALLSACNQGDGKQKDTTQSGEVNIVVEESFKPLFQTSAETFESQNVRAKLDISYVSEAQAFDAFLNGETSTICVTRDFTEEEKENLRKTKQIEVRSNIIAIDAIALIVHPENTDTLMTVDRIKNLISGKDTLWQGTNRRINIVFDNPNSANFLYLRKLVEINQLPANVFAVKSNEEVINYVKENRNALGVIGVNWISDEEDPTTWDFKDGIKVVSVAKKEGEEYFKPYQAYIYEEYHLQKGYPLVREAWMINKAGRTSLNAGFINFMLGEKGQLIVQKASLLPAKLVPRRIQFSE